MTQAAVAAEVHQPLDVERDLAAQVAFDLVALLERLADAVDLVVGQVLGPARRIDLGRGADLPRARVADAVEVGERDLDLLLAGKIDSCNSRHSFTPAAACDEDSPRRSRAPRPCGGSPCTSRKSSSPKHGPSRLPPAGIGKTARKSFPSVPYPDCR